MENTVGVFHNCNCFSPPSRASWRFLMALSPENPVECPEVKSTTVWTTSWEHGPRSFSHTQPLSVFIRFLDPNTLAPGEQMSALTLDLPFGSRMAVYLHLWVSGMFRKVIYFQFAWYSCSKDVTDSVQAFYMLGAETRWIKKSCGRHIP